MPKRISAGDKFGGLDALARKQEFVRHLPKGETCCEGRHGEDRGPGKDRCQRFGKFCVRDRPGRYQVHRALQQVAFQNVVKRLDPILYVNPTPPLSAAAHITAKTHAERQQHLLQRSPDRAKNQSSAHLHGPDSGLSCWLRRSLPFATNFREKTFARRAVFAQDFVATVTVVTDGRSCDEYSRTIFGFR